MISVRFRRLFIVGIIILCIFILITVVGIKERYSKNTTTTLTNHNKNIEKTFSVEPNKSVMQSPPIDNISAKEPAKNIEIGEKLDFIDKEVVTRSAKKASQDLWKTKYSETTEFVKLQWTEGMDYNLVKEMVKKDQLPVLYKLLDSNDYSPYWHNIARIIGYISDDPNSVPVLVNYFQRNDGSKVESVVGKIWSIAFIGKIGGDSVDSTLKRVLTKEGAEDLAKSWINDQKWKNARILDKDLMISYTQNAAMQGLVYTLKPENWKIIENLYNEQKEISIKNQKQTDIMSHLVDAMVAKAYIADNNNNVEAYFRLNSQNRLKTLGPYIEKYTLLKILNKPR